MISGGCDVVSPSACSCAFNVANHRCCLYSGRARREETKLTEVTLWLSSLRKQYSRSPIQQANCSRSQTGGEHEIVCCIKIVPESAFTKYLEERNHKSVPSRCKGILIVEVLG